ncbi:MFS transporter [Ihubacter massiliensis]|uniref:MFS transporter n=1 Tax=Hominibacterium faecale TaxID=2839743 RepID=A0A9J6QJA1_9FIRM|nr:MULTISPECIES: MFS transporter [Eubacteriales Family XIII. Incertae Sedis]MCO7122923.1 MFS transporter [Ihubacter massiliensis]MCU7377185.1 MFS transporter [Hominibacterium faecale]
MKEINEKFYTKSNFGAKGWLLIIFVGLMLMFCSALTNDGLNIVIPVIAGENGWDYAQLLAYSTPAGFISVIGVLVLSVLTDKFGAKLITIISLLIAAASYIWYGHAQSPTQYFIALTLMSTFATGAAWVSGGAYLAMYFPRKKGLALGWATMGNNLCTLAMVPLLSMMTAAFGGMGNTTLILGVVIAALIGFCFVLPNKPEDAGMTPDNLPMSADEIQQYRKEANAYVSPWTYKKLLLNKEMWLISLVLGITMMITVGIVSQMVTRLTSSEIGWEQPKAVAALSVAAGVGIVGSYLWGVLDQKITTKKATAIYMVWYGIAAFLNVVPGSIPLYISIFMIGFALGGNANWPVSLCSSVFGHMNFAKVYSLVCPIYTFIRCCAFAVLAFFISTTGSLSGAYILFGVMAIIGAGLTILINDKKYADGKIN